MIKIDPKKVRRTWITDDRLIELGACWLLYVLVVPDGSVSAHIKLYDGHNTRGEVAAEFRTFSARSEHMDPPLPIYFKQGLYVECVTSLDGVMLLTYAGDRL